MQHYSAPAIVLICALYAMAGFALWRDDIHGATFAVSLATIVAVINRKEG